MESETTRAKSRARVVGGIFRWQPTTAEAPIRYAVVQGRHSEIWSFPKGHAKRGETLEETARREIEEETGWSVLPAASGSRRVASVRYFMYEFEEYRAIDPRDRKEIKDARWMTREELREVQVNRGVAEYLKL